MKKKSILLLFWGVLFFNYPTLATSLAVLDFNTTFEADNKNARNISRFIRIGLTKEYDFDVADNDESDKILLKQDFQFKGNCEDISCDVKKGMLIGVDYLISGALNSIDDNYFLVIKLININKKELVGMVSKDIPKASITQIKENVKELVANLFSEKDEITNDTTSSLSRKLCKIDITSKPDSASVFINGIKTGFAPYVNSKVLPGEYKVDIKLGNHKTISDIISLENGGLYKNNFFLSYTEHYKDSLRHEFFTKNGGRNSRRIAFGVVSLLSAGAGFLFDYLANEESEDAQLHLENYNEATGNFEIHKEQYKKSEEAFNQNVKYRNILYGISGGMLLGFFISIPF